MDKLNATDITNTDLEKEEPKREISDWMKEYIRQETIRSQIQKELMSNTEYIKWLDAFTQDKDGFSDDDWLYFPEKIEESDKKNVEKLNIFYEGIDDYAKKNYIRKSTSDFSGFYNIKLDDLSFEIGMIRGQGVFFYCKRIDINDEKEFIDFNDIMFNRKLERADEIAKDLEALSNMIISIYEKGAPVDAIMNTLDSALKEVKSKNDEKILKK